MRRPPISAVLPSALALSALLTAGAVALPAHAGPAEGPSVTPVEPASAGTSHEVRLITGDSVVVTGTGEKATVAFRPDSDNPTGIASIVRHGKDITVVPDEARPLLDAGILDPRLFEVDELIEQGYANGRDLPLIVQNADGSADTPDAMTKTRGLRSVRGLAARVKSKDATRMWHGLRAGAGAKKLAGGVQHVWLDAKVTAQLDKSVPQIGAPTAWASGYDGKGVKVAVLDTGIDAGHPDIAASLVEARNFSTSADAVDRHGHGTHVASTVIGSGAASGGLYKGVAPKAELLVGKVLGDNGSGSDSTVLAGMEWAANSGARVVSMSLGAPVQSNGTDPMSTAVNNLTASTGALFVIAAGNSGPNATTLGAPGVADAALTVAAVDKQDKMAVFSSRGPRYGDAALKPDIAAPGVDIVAARAAGTTMGTPAGAGYTTASGTSMATPHVAGAAAILAQRHPDWKAADLKGALMASAKVLDNSAFAEGSGRVDIPKALDASAWANNASFGRYLYTQKTAPVTRTVTFHNTADHEVTLDLAATLKREGSGTVDGVLGLGADTLTIPAGGAKEVTATADIDAAPASGAYTGTITATGDGVTAHATVAFLRELPTFTIKVKATMPDGSPATAPISLYNLRSNNPPVQLRFGSDGVATAQVTAGRYTVLGYLRNTSSTDIVSFAIPDINVTDQDVTLTADGSKAKEITVTTPRPVDTGGMALAIGRRSDEQQIGVGTIITASATSAKRYALPTAAAQDGTFNFTKFWTLQSAAYRASALLADGRLDLRPSAFAYAARFDGTRSLKVTDAGYGTAGELAATDVTGRLALVRQGSEPLQTVLKRVDALNPAAIMVVYPNESRVGGALITDRPVLGVQKSLGDKVAAAVAAAASADDDVVVRLTGTLNSSYSYGLFEAQTGGIGHDQDYAPDAARLATVKVTDRLPGADLGGLGFTQEGWVPLATETGTGVTSLPMFQLGTSRTVYLQADNALWQRIAYPVNGGPRHSGWEIPYKAGSYQEQDWFSSVMHPATNSDASKGTTASGPYRDQNGMLVSFNLWTTGDGRSGESAGGVSGVDQKSFRIYADGQLVGTAASPSVFVKNLPAQKTDYRFELDEARTDTWWTVSTKSHTEWSFSSAAAEGDAKVKLPILEADYDLDGVRIDNTVATGSKHDLKLRFRLADGSAVKLTKAKIEVSYDGGTTWSARSVDRGDSTARATLSVPKDARSVSLRISGTDASGSAITQTITDAARVG